MGLFSFLSGMFSPNSVTGLVTSTYRNFDSGALYVNLRLDSGEISLQVGDPLADEIERVLINRKRRGQQTTMTLEYDPQTYAITSYSIVS